MNNHAQSLREELKAVHEAYKKKVKEIDLRRIDCLRDLERYDELFHSVDVDRDRLSEANLRLGLLNERTEKDAEGWKSAALRYQYLFEQMDRVGLQQSQDIFECYKDIEVPRISIREKNKYVTTHLTGSEIVDEIEENVVYDDDIDTEIEVLEIYNEYNEYNEYDEYDEYNEYNEYEGLNELFREENNVESTEFIFEIPQYPQELYEDYIDRLTHHINRQLILSYINYTSNL